VASARRWLRCYAPFAQHAQRYSGGTQPTWPVPTPSEAYGLVCNACCIDVNDYGQLPSLPMRPDAPRFHVAIGEISTGGSGEMLVHRHIHRVGKEMADPRGMKASIEPARIAVLAQTVFVIGIDADDEMLNRLEPGLRGDLPHAGFLVAGNSDCLVDRVDVLELAPQAHWYVQVSPFEPLRPGAHRFPVWIDRKNEGRSRWAILAPTEETAEVPRSAWIGVGPDSST